MAHGLGFHSGLLEGTVALRKLAQGDQQLANDEQRLGLQAEEVGSQNLMRQAQREELLRKMAREDYTSAMLQQAFAKNQGTQMSIDGDAALAEQSIAAGKAIIGTDPKTGLDLIKQGQSYKTSAITTELQKMQIQKAKVEMQGDIAAGITDQASLEEAIPALAKLGVAVPEKYRTWSPEAKSWWENRKIASDNYLKKIQIEETKRAHDLQATENESKQKAREENLRIARQREERQRAKVESTARKMKEPTAKSVEMEVQTLAANNDLFDDLPPGQKLQAARDVYYRAAELYSSGEAADQAEALQMAREEIFGSLEEDGYFSSKYSGANGKKPPTAPSQDEWLVAAKKANPGVPEEQLVAYYTQTYGK